MFAVNGYEFIVSSLLIFKRKVILGGCDIISGNCGCKATTKSSEYYSVKKEVLL